MVSYLGKNLNIIISCDHIPGHNWMSYICWYSIRKNLPDANVSLVCKRHNVSGYLFLWTKKVGVPFKMYSSSEDIISTYKKPNLVVPPFCLAVRDFDEAGIDPSFIKDNDSILLEDTNLVCDAKEDKFSVFCSYEDGWGRFITKEWINKTDCPLSFFSLKKFSSSNMSLNEKLVKNMWDSSLRLFQAISGGVVL
jgi:hypothetical protein